MFWIILGIVAFVSIAWPVTMMLLSLQLRKKAKLEFLSNYSYAELPRHKGTYILNPEFVDLDVVSDMLTTFIDAYKKKFPQARSLKNLLPFRNLNFVKSELIIEFVKGQYFMYRGNDNVEFPEGHPNRQKVNAQMMGRNGIICATKSDGDNETQLGKTALIHEFNHWALAFTENDFGHDHTDPPWTKEHNELARELNSKYLN